MRRKIILILSLMLLVGIPAVYAQPIAGVVFEQYPKVNVKVNGSKINSSISPFVIEGTSVTPIRSLAQAMGGFVSYDDGTVNITKPYVNMIIAKEIQTNNGRYQISNPFMAVKKGLSGPFDVFVEVANAPQAEELYFKLVIVDEVGVEKFSSPTKVYSESQFYTTYQISDFTFDSVNDYYTVKFLMRTPASDYVTIGQNVIYVK